MSLHLWEAVHEADIRSDPLFDIDAEVVASPPPSLQRVLLAAATLWCRTLTWPTVREISTAAAVAASTSIRAAGSSEGLRAVLIDSEILTILNRARDQLDDGSTGASVIRQTVTDRIRRLGSIDPALARLPMVIGLAHGLESLALLAHVAHVDVMLEGPASASAVA